MFCNLGLRAALTLRPGDRGSPPSGCLVQFRQACQGHNVAPDGGKNNPYTVDHKNHPGLFNASGHIGLLGHGAGIKFRNIRIKELPAAKTKK